MLMGIVGIVLLITACVSPAGTQELSEPEENFEARAGSEGEYLHFVQYFTDQWSGEKHKGSVCSLLCEWLPRLLPALVSNALHPLLQVGWSQEGKSAVGICEGLAYAAAIGKASPAIIDCNAPPTPEEKISMLQVLRSLEEKGFEVAEAMAKIVKERFSANFGLSTTGVMAPDNPGGKPPGLTYVGLADSKGTRSWQQNFARFRDEAGQREAIAALFRLRERLIELKIANP